MEQLLIYTRHMYFFLKILKQVVLLSKLLNLVWSVLIMMMAMKVLMVLWSSIYEMGWVFFSWTWDAFPNNAWGSFNPAVLIFLKSLIFIKILYWFTKPLE